MGDFYDSDGDVEIITPQKNSSKRPLVDEDDEESGVAAVGLSQQTDDEVIVSSGSKKQKRTVVLDESDEDSNDDSVTLATIGSSTPARRESKDTAPRRRQSHPPTPPRRASRRLSVREEQKERAHGSLLQKLQRKSLNTCLPTPPSYSKDDFVAASDEEVEEDDSDAFVVNDDEVEYMDDDEANAVIDVHEDDEDEDEEDPRAYRGSRDTSEWFAIYMHYLEHCLLDEDFETNHRVKLFREASEHIERRILQRRDSLRGNVHWPDDLVESINLFPSQYDTDADGENLCYACNRRSHPASITIHFSGIACDAKELYRPGWRKHLFDSLEADEESHCQFEVGSKCFQRVLLYWALHQSKRQLCAVIWRKLQQFDGKKLPDEERTKLQKTEYGRYKRLLNMVDAMETKDGFSTVHNVWSKVTPMAADASVTSGSKRRGDVTSLVDDDDDDDDSLAKTNGRVDNEEEEEKEELDSPPKASSRRASLVRESPAKAAAAPSSAPTHASCLVCKKRGRTGGVLHGYYVHIYCCFECAKRLKEQKKPCAVCARPIERVIHLLPLLPDEEKAIQEEYNN
ncbi:Aste57867_10146 [Aphanomyces stellatus]|uniref:Aste57867_10146 protein n=1 Tax=Aphanomyces stellatus TaxID=120398 RepID=A0A485KPN5_9STRA|nr:hypothetical protein As57867_010107 [Aphanomyces stellatus]VFT87022.1 Aste57867_10146 [Aphanomyces stellatus]